MHILLSALLAATPSPSATTDPSQYYSSPGTIGFVMTFFITVGAIALIFDMVRRIRRVRYRSEIAEKLIAEAEAKVDAKPVAKAKPARPAPPAKPQRNKD